MTNPFNISMATMQNFFDAFETTPDEVEHIVGQPTFLLLYAALQYVEGILMAI